jgi:uncharacterized SAM-dependent methyltransferase
MEAEQKQMAAELAKMQRELEELQNLPEMQTIKTEVVVRTLQSLDSLGIPVPVNVDSILKDVQKSIKKVEVKVEKK